MKYTVFGASGFIGSELALFLRDNNIDVYTPKRDDPGIYTQELGIVIYCAGNGDCGKQPLNVLNANTVLLSSIITRCNFTRLVYLSSTRVYMNSMDSNESADLIVGESDNRRLFNLTKLVAEELCLKSEKDCVIVRPANVYGKAFSSPLFLPAITRDAILNGVVNMYVSPEYNKDYVSVHDVVDAIYFLSQNTLKHRIYNIASGINTRAIEIAEILQKKTACQIVWHESKQEEIFPVTNISRLKSEMNFEPKNVLDDMSGMIDNFRVIINA
ncbi:TPA: NAD-dependent epimerase/dehydratase family protein [Citrobacter amalonaticus]|uniref:NAD-dependent epimerase/dehydratase family protein n=1 Tax=Citrobacter amalonaticus TaxID=35703 RepID=UPI00389391CB|nr:NAD(P)-dependent oxidoreductase [Citrobacter amalonaticus]